MHHAVTMAKSHDFNIGVEGQAKCFSSAVPSLGCANFGPVNALRMIQLVPIRSQGTRSCQSKQCPLGVGYKCGKHCDKCIFHEQISHIKKLGFRL